MTNEAPLEDDGREKFYHPYTPYDIQVDFMTSLYDTLDRYKIGIFESPTGTVSAVNNIVYNAVLTIG